MEQLVVIVDGDPIVVENAFAFRDDDVLLKNRAAQNAISAHARFLRTLKAALEFPGKPPARAIKEPMP